MLSLLFPNIPVSILSLQELGMGLGVGGWEVWGLKKGKRESVEVIKPLSFEEQDPEPLPPTGHGKKQAKEQRPIDGKEWRTWVLMLKWRNTSGKSPKIDLKRKYRTRMKHWTHEKPLIKPQTHNEQVKVKKHIKHVSCTSRVLFLLIITLTCQASLQADK